MRIKLGIASFLVFLPLLLFISGSASNWVEYSDTFPDECMDSVAVIEIGTQRDQYQHFKVHLLTASSLALDSGLFSNTFFLVDFKKTPILSEKPSVVCLRI